MSVRERPDLLMERAIARITGVVRAKVRFDDGLPIQVYAIASGDRTQDEVICDIQSLAVAGFNIDLDRSAISVVRLTSGVADPSSRTVGPSIDPPQPPDLDQEEASRKSTSTTRPAIEQVFVAREGDSGWIRVSLRWPAGALTEGTAPATERRPSRARGAAEATLVALSPQLAEKGLNLEIDEVAERTVAGRPSVLVYVFCEGGGKKMPLMGSAFVRDDIGSATVKAVLNAVDRII